MGQLVNQGVAADLADAAAAQAITAGVDIDMVFGAYAAHLAELVQAGRVPLELVDDAARRVIRLKMRQGLFEHPYAEATSSPAEPTAQSRLLAREAAASSFMLLSNNGALPLSARPPSQLSYYDRSMTLRTDAGEAVVIVGPDAASGACARFTVTN